MNSTWTALENSTGEIKVTCSGEAWQKAQEKAFKKIASKVKVPGFRGGKAPLEMIKKQIDDKTVLIEAVESLAGELLLDAIKEHDLSLVARPELEIDSLGKESADLTFKCVVKPEVSLGAYKNVFCAKDEVKVSEEDIDAQVDKLRENLAELLLKENGEVTSGDTAVIDFKGFLEGEEFENGSAENYPLEIGSGNFVPGFEEQILGMRNEEEKDIEVVFPEDYQSKHLAGKPVTFKVKVNEIKEKILPFADDDFAKGLEREGVSNLAELRQSIYNNLLASATKKAEDKFRNELFDLIVNDAKVEVPQVMIDDEADYLYSDFINKISAQGFNEELYFQLSGQNKESLMEQFRTDGHNKVKLRLVLEAIANQEAIEVEDSEVEDEYQKIADQYQRDIKEIKDSIRSNDLQLDLKLRKAMDIVINSAVS